MNTKLPHLYSGLLESKGFCKAGDCGVVAELQVPCLVNCSSACMSQANTETL